MTVFWLGNYFETGLNIGCNYELEFTEAEHAVCGVIALKLDILYLTHFIRSKIII